MKYQQHDIIVLTKPVTCEEGSADIGQIGIIVHGHHPKSDRYEVAFEGRPGYPGLVTTVPVSSMRPEATCVYCGCTDSKACAGSCTWVELHQHTPTGVCSGCTASIKGLQRLDIGKFILIKPGAKGHGHVWFERTRGEGMDLPETKLATALKKLFTQEF